MACGCSKGRSISGEPGPNAKYIFTDPTTGREYTYNTAYEAKYAKLRAGGGSIRVENG